MQKLLLTMAVMLIPAYAAAQSPCCDTKPCPEGFIVQKGPTPFDSQCCDETDPTSCVATYGAGYACNLATDPEYAASNTPGTGCLEAPDGTCAGGDARVPAGCICVGAVGCETAITDLGIDPTICTSRAVDACCAAGSCH